MDVLVISGIVIISVAAIGAMKKIKGEYALFLSILLGLILLRQAARLLSGEITFLKDLLNDPSFDGTQGILLKIIGISIAVETTSDICRDAGENSVASKIELLGKVELLLISIPLLKKILELTKQIMN